MLRGGSPSPTCHLSNVMRPVSNVTCDFILIILIYFYKGLKLFGYRSELFCADIMLPDIILCIKIAIQQRRFNKTLSKCAKNTKKMCVFDSFISQSQSFVQNIESFAQTCVRVYVRFRNSGSVINGANTI